MGVYVSITTDNPKAATMPPARVRFAPLGALPDAQRAAWDKASVIPLEDWAAPFMQGTRPVALSLKVNPEHKTIACIAGYVEEDAPIIIQADKPASGYLARSYNPLEGRAYLSGARSDSLRVREDQFISRSMAAFHAIDRTTQIKDVTIAAVGAVVACLWRRARVLHQVWRQRTNPMGKIAECGAEIGAARFNKTGAVD